MKILLINKFHFVQGGADRHYLELGELLRQQGHEVIYFSMNHPDNQPCAQAEYFLDYLDFFRVGIDRQLFKKIKRMWWSREAQVKLEKLIMAEKPDVAHLHNIYHQISPAIIPVLKKFKIPIVLTVHDYYLLSPAYTLFARNEIFDPVRWRHCQAVVKRAIKNSLAASVLASLTNWWHQHRGYYLGVDCFISPSRFLAAKLREFYPGINIKVLPNFILDWPEEIFPPANYYLFVGRLVPEKGIEMFLRAAAQLPDQRFLVAGQGPEQAALMKRYDLPNVRWLGQLAGVDLQNVLARARALIFPSQWYENFPLAILESFASGVPVIASRLGGVPELVQSGVNGQLFAPSDLTALVAAIKEFDTDSKQRQHLSDGARETARQYRAENYYRELMKIYEGL